MHLLFLHTWYHGMVFVALVDVVVVVGGGGGGVSTGSVVVVVVGVAAVVEPVGVGAGCVTG